MDDDMKDEVYSLAGDTLPGVPPSITFVESSSTIPPSEPGIFSQNDTLAEDSLSINSSLPPLPQQKVATSDKPSRSIQTNRRLFVLMVVAGLSLMATSLVAIGLILGVSEKKETSTGQPNIDISEKEETQKSPTVAIIVSPTVAPSVKPSTMASELPSLQPSYMPSTASPSSVPSLSPSSRPSMMPSKSLTPTRVASSSPSTHPSIDPIPKLLTLQPTLSSIPSVSAAPIHIASDSPSLLPSLSPVPSVAAMTITLPTFAPSLRRSPSTPDASLPSEPTLSPTDTPKDACRSPPTPPPKFPGKKGICMTLRPEGKQGSWRENLPRVQALNGYWNYKWGLERLDAQPEDLEFVPMLWGGRKNPRELQAAFEEHLFSHIASGTVRRFIGFNEPDKEEQSNISVERALQMWPQMEALGLPMVSPSCADPLGPWMDKFMSNATSKCLRVDWIGVHWYGGVNPDVFKYRMRRIYRKYGKPLVLTEFAPADYKAQTVNDNRHSPREVLNFAKIVLPWLESREWIAGYAWFPFDITKPQGTSSALFDEEGDLTPLGRYYASVRTEKPNGNRRIQIN